MILMVSILFLISCRKKGPLVGKWELIDEKVSCTNPIFDSLEKTKIGIYKSGELINKDEVENEVRQQSYFSFTSDLKYVRKAGQTLISGTYKMKDSFLLTTQPVLDMDFVTGGYSVHFIDKNNLQLTEEMTIKDQRHIHTYNFFLRRKLN
jgi:hypothetical protein